ncbi:MAG: hypothetical protein A2860_03315 [Candidatus Levybacteria bacterium RIFCSPHIGHO2_01_FULL_37_33]|nr:MAG: hypothetical protein A2860_03315 [Candidatus Levybacteria bacterium RIFCSPHIGHO2_01_FULL_37_33]OGH17454.1 MAG: hypothetical protein A3C97_03325 [Candidatus Levybacteria bacterium RIFCSPHIGHO2_02_FULL_37_11]OGH29894.1 MAG: hypothetical protein A3F30_01750 [Candidatus Levybacteria bacterium RIFCSPHIGHO2_12_FULL_37_12]OGH33000.1 MAG: hypothetical protein A2953_01110 [Candidatus Levybacteria bacterium RIFCSPLOWO2_01_FULL_36_54]
MLFYILFFTLIGSVFSLIGGVVILFKEKLALRISHLLFSFAAGTLLGTAFFDLLPEAASNAPKDINIFLWALIGFLVFFLIERFIHWFHHHHEHPAEPALKPTVALITLGDSVHNFIDGVAIAASFLVNIPLGIVTSLAVAAHEIPQEIGDFSILLHKGVDRKKVLLLNLLSSAAAIVGAVLTFLMADFVTGLLPVFLSVTAGFFIYIAASDLIPEIHEKNKAGFAFIESFLLILGIFAIWVFVSLLGR